MKGREWHGPPPRSRRSHSARRWPRLDRTRPDKFITFVDNNPRSLKIKTEPLLDGLRNFDDEPESSLGQKDRFR
jgi:hypothetical protein